MLMRLRWALVAVCGLCFAAPAANASLAKPHFTQPSFYSTQASFGFLQPIGMAVAPGGRMFVTDNAGIVWTTMGGGAKAKPLFDLSEHVNEIQDRGLISVAVDKNYSVSRKIYLAYTFEDRSKAELEGDSSLAELPKTERLVWVKVPSELELEAMTEPIELEPEDEHVVLGGYSSDPKRPGVPFSTSHACPQPSDLVKGDWSTANESDCIPDDSIEHTIDSVRVDPSDGTLWVSVGDGADGGATLDPDSWRSQRPESYSGKLLHVSTTGEGLPGHPFCPSDEDLTDVCTKVYAKGFRNPFRFFFRPSPDGRPTVADAGWSTREELDLAEKGKNYGWPCREGKIATPTWSEEAQCVELASKETFTEPVYDYHPSGGGAILGGITYSGGGGENDYPAEFKGAIFITDLITSKLQYLRLNEAGTAVEPGYPKVLAEEVMAVDWAPASNGDLMYVDIGFGEDNIAQIRRISFDPKNAPPEALLTADKTFGKLPLHVKFDASNSTDPNGNELSYAWDFNEDGKTDSTSSHPERTFEKSVNTDVALTVEDGKGGEDTKSIEIFAGDGHAPEPSFDSGPTTYTDGEPVKITGSATDQDDGSLGSEALFWKVRLNHAGTHVHPITEKGGVGSVQFTTDTAHDAPSFYEVELTATDSRGLKTTTEQNLNAKTRLVRIDSSPEGAPIGYGGVPQTAPFEKQSTIGLITTISSAPSFEQAGHLFEFDHWSNGKPLIWDLTVPDEDLDLTAVYAESEPELTLTVSKAGSGEGTVTGAPGSIDCGDTCSDEFEGGTVVTLSAYPDGESTFAGWSGGGCSGSGTCEVTLASNTTVTATFTKNAPNERSLTVNKSGSGAGTVVSNPAGIDCGSLCSHSFAEDTVVKLTPTPNLNSSFAGWTGDCSSTGLCQVTMDQARNVGAAFLAKSKPLEPGGDAIVKPPPDRFAATLSFNPKHGLSKGRKQSLLGTVVDTSGVREVQIALREAKKVKGRCRWWSPAKGDFPKGTASCSHPAYMKAQLKGSGDEVSWSVALKGRLSKGRYVLVFRTEDSAGNVGKPQVSLVVK